jgi:hypothetical protein
MKKIIYLFLIYMLVSCDLLTTRNPEPPNTLANNNIPATNPDSLIKNFKSSIENKILENYVSCFVDTAYLKRKFRFIPSAGSASQYQVLNGWNIESEKQYFQNQIIKAVSGTSIALTLSNQLNTQFGDSADYQFDYNLAITSNDQNINGNYSGSADFKVLRDTRNQWVIVDWTDVRKGNFISWSDLKGRLY